MPAARNHILGGCNHIVSAAMSEIGLCQAKMQLSELIERGETLTLTRHGRPVARIVPVAERRTGLLKGRIGMAADFDETPGWLADAFEGGPGDGDLLKP
jgi:prevent-host-death family protein